MSELDKKMRSILAGNWKMNMEINEARVLVDELKKEMEQFPTGVEVVIAPAFPFLLNTVEQCDKTQVQVAGAELP